MISKIAAKVRLFFIPNTKEANNLLYGLKNRGARR
jgi:hypothetical protein